MIIVFNEYGKDEGVLYEYTGEVTGNYWVNGKPYAGIYYENKRLCIACNTINDAITMIKRWISQVDNEVIGYKRNEVLNVLRRMNHEQV